MAKSLNLPESWALVEEKFERKHGEEEPIRHDGCDAAGGDEVAN